MIRMFCILTDTESADLDSTSFTVHVRLVTVRLRSTPRALYCIHVHTPKNKLYIRSSSKGDDDDDFIYHCKKCKAFI